MIELRSYQERLIGQARAKMMAGCRRLLLQSPAGSGKTVMSSYMVKGVRDRNLRAMFMVHREELARQASRTLKAFGLHHGYVMASMTMDARQQVLIAMIDTLRNRLEKISPPNLLIVDECHHAASPSWAKVIDYYIKRGAYVIGLSATPQRLDGKALSPLFDDIVLGPQVKELIAAGALSEYTYYRPPTLIDVTGIKSRGGDYATDELAAVSDQAAIIGDAVEHYKKIMGGKRAIAFAVNIAHSEHIAAQYRQAGIPAVHVDGETPAVERLAAIEAFARGDIKVMSNVGLFGEGFDVPACEGVQMLRATQSLAWHIQACGRAMRPHEGKGKAIILDHVNNLVRHGLPDEEREWSLEGRTKSSRRKAEDDDDLGPMMKQCPNCYTINSPPGPVCTACGQPFERQRKEIEQADGELVEVKESEKDLIARRRRIEVARAETLDELKAIAAQRGYKEKWAEHVFKARGKKSALRM